MDPALLLWMTTHVWDLNGLEPSTDPAERFRRGYFAGGYTGAA